MDQHPVQGGVVIIFILFYFVLLETKIITKIVTNTCSFNYLSNTPRLASCYRNRYKLRPCGPLARVRLYL